jgi:uncharacterized protein YndB with AHSA1/START domain
MSDRSTEHATFVIERTYDAGREPEQKVEWFGPRELDKPDHELDFREGGHERMTVRAPDGALYTFTSRFQDIVEGSASCTPNEMYRDNARISVSVATIELAAAGGGTKLTFTEQGVFLDGLDDAAEREHGTRELLDALGAALTRESVER